MPYDPKIHHRRSIRLAGYDYTLPGAYFVTLNTQVHQCILGELIEGELRLSPIGEIVNRCWFDLPNHFPIDLDAWVIMPDHLHGVLMIRGKGEAFGGQGSGKSVTPAPNASPLRPHGTSPCIFGCDHPKFQIHHHPQD